MSLGSARPATGNILVIDASESNRIAFGSLLGEWGYDVLAAESMLDALREMAKTGWSPDVVLARHDPWLSDTGVAAIRAISARCGRDLAGVLIADALDPERAREARDRGYVLLRGPLRPARLRSAIRYGLLNPPSIGRRTPLRPSP